ncbi:MAG: AI-2E family transporter [Bacteroidales bacterium]
MSRLGVRGVILLLVFLALGIFCFWYFFRIVIYILVSAVLSLLGEPIAEFLHRIHIRKVRVPHGVAAFVTLLFMIGTLVLIILNMVPLLGKQASLLSDVSTQGILNSLEEPLSYFESLFKDWQVLAPDETIGKKAIAELASIATFERFTNLFNSVMGLMVEIFIGFLSISFITFFFLKEKNLFSRMMIFLTPRQYKAETETIMKESKVLMRRYFVGLITDLVAVFILISISMWFLGLRNALVIGFFAGILNIIPYVGPIIATLIGVFLGISINLDMEFYSQMLPLILKIISVFIIVNTIDIGVLQPAIYSKSVKSHPLEIFIVFLAAGIMGGVFGMIIAIPAYTVIRILAKVIVTKSALLLAVREELQI